MPNGGEHYETIGFCPHCRSSNIGKRRQVHRSMNWRCRNCNRIFQRPDLREAVIHGDGSGFVFESDVARLDSQVARRFFRSRKRSRRRSSRRFKRTLLVVFLLLSAALLVYLFLNPQVLDRFRKEVAGNITDLRTSVGISSRSDNSGMPSSESSSLSADNIRPDEQQEINGLMPSSEIDRPGSFLAPPPATVMPPPKPVAIPSQEETEGAATPQGSSSPFSRTVHFFCATAVGTPTPVPPPNQCHLPEKELMLQLINQERMSAGLEPVELGANVAAQLHAESSLANCTSSHWGPDGLKPYMRYSLAGGYQSNGENGHGSDYCITPRDNYRALGPIEREIKEAVDGWMRSPGHRDNLLDGWHRKVNIGLAWDRYNFVAYQHFEGDFVEYETLPSMENGVLSVRGRTKNGIEFRRARDLGGENGHGCKSITISRHTR